MLRVERDAEAPLPGRDLPQRVDVGRAADDQARLIPQLGQAGGGGIGEPRARPRRILLFRRLPGTIEYAKELPFSGGVSAWAGANKPVLDKFIVAYNKSVNWFQDRNNRAAAVKIMMEVGRQKQDDVEKSYDFLQKGNFYELTGKIPRGSLDNLIKVLQELGDLPPSFTVDRLLMPGVAEIPVLDVGS